MYFVVTRAYRFSGMPCFVVSAGFFVSAAAAAGAPFSVETTLEIVSRSLPTTSVASPSEVREVSCHPFVRAMVSLFFARKFVWARP